MTTPLPRLAFVLVIFALALLPQTHAAGCFLYPESPYYCQDISKNLAQEECNLQGCDLRLFYKSTSCSNLPPQESCTKVFCKSTCTLISSRDCKSGIVPQNEKDIWCNSGCCQYSTGSDNTCIATPSRYACEQNAKTSQANQYSYQITSTPCTLQCSRGLSTTITSNLNSSPISTPPKSAITNSPPTDSTPTDSTPTDSASGIGSYILLFIMVLILSSIIAVLVIFRAKSKSSFNNFITNHFRTNNSPTTNDNDNISSPSNDSTYPSQNRSIFFNTLASTKDLTNPEQPRKNSHKSHQVSRIHAFESFSSNTDSKKGTFDQLNHLVSTKKTALEKLSKLHSKIAPNLKIPPKTQGNANPKSSLEDLRQIATTKKR